MFGHGFDGFARIIFFAEGDTNIFLYPCSSVFIRVLITFLALISSGCLIFFWQADTRGLTQTATECFRIKLQGDLSAEGHDIHLSDGSAPIDFGKPAKWLYPGSFSKKVCVYPHVSAVNYIT